MKKLGLLGGMSWESTVTYYKIINEKVGAALGGNSSADMIIRSLNLAEIEWLQDNDRWDAVAYILAEAAGDLERAGAEFIVMASNTVHKVYDQVAESVNVPIIHIADPVVEAVRNFNAIGSGLNTVGLLGTRYTMEGDFLKEKLEAAGVSVVVPDEEAIAQIHQAIFTEAVVGKVKSKTKNMFIDVIDDLAKKGAQGVILGCTELGLMINPDDSKLPLFDTAVLHAVKAAEEVLV